MFPLCPDEICRKPLTPAQDIGGPRLLSPATVTEALTLLSRIDTDGGKDGRRRNEKSAPEGAFIKAGRRRSVGGLLHLAELGRIAELGSHHQQ